MVAREGRWFRPLLCGWVVFQLLTLTLVPAALCAGLVTEHAALACTCAHGEGQACPMHHPSPVSESDCSCKSSDPVMTLASLLGPVAVLAPESADMGALVASECAPHPILLSTDWLFVPDSPPPRS